MFFNGRINPGRVSLFWNCQTATSLRAASSAWELQARNSSVGLLLKLVQKLRPSQPSSQGSSTENRLDVIKSSETVPTGTFVDAVPQILFGDLGEALVVELVPRCRPEFGEGLGAQLLAGMTGGPLTTMPLCRVHSDSFDPRNVN
jgi:hypothetical protein